MDGQQFNGRPGSSTRMSVDQALQYTPLISIDPFMHDIIPPPQAGPTTLGAPLLDDADRRAAHKTLGRFDYELSSLQHTSDMLQETLQNLRNLISPESLQTYSFPPPKSPTWPASNDRPPHSASPPHLGSFARLLLDSSQITWKAAPESYQSQAQPSSNINQQSFIQNNLIPLAERTPTTSKQKSHVNTPEKQSSFPGKTSPPSGSPLVVLPQSYHSLSEFHSHPGLDAALIRQQEQEEEARRRRTMSQNAQDALGDLNVDSRERANNALTGLHDIFHKIFQAEDRLESGDLGDALLNDNPLFTRSTHGDEPYVLAPAVVSKLDTTISKTVTAKRIGQVDAEYLLRAEKLCHKVILQCAEFDLALPEETSEDSILSWLPTLSTVDSAMAASRAILRIMIARREEKELCSEEVLSDLLNVFKPVVEGCIVPMVETKATADIGQILKGAPEGLAALGSLLQRAGRVLRHLGDLLLHVDLSETAITRVEDLCLKLVFVANSSSEKESIFGIQKFEAFRRNSMDVLAKIFLRRPSQRTSILGEILSSLEKLPVARQGARQFKIPGAKPIQLVSALVMQLVHTAASQGRGKSRKSFLLNGHGIEDESDDEASNAGQTNGVMPPHGPPVERLGSTSREMLDSARGSASQFSKYLIGRALTSSKSGDEPYRNLLDIFTEDFINVLGSPEWPAAELLLQYLLRELVVIMNDEKRGAPAKSMALDLMGVMGSGIADVRQYLERVSQTQEEDEADNLGYLKSLASAYFEGEDIGQDLMGLKGPYRAVIDSLDYRADDDLPLEQARNYYVLQWASLCCAHGARQSIESNDSEPASITGLDELAKWLLTVIDNPRYISETSNESFKGSTNSARIASALVILNTTFCKANFRIFSTLVQSITSPHATVRSKALKSVYQLLEKDPSVLTGPANVIRHIVGAAADQSTMVRDSALGLVGKAMALRPELEGRCLPLVVTWASDITPGIRKRALRLLKEAYDRNAEESSRLSAATAILHRLSDDEESVRILARQTLAELWIAPYLKVAGSSGASPEAKNGLQKHAAVLIAIADQSEEALNAFEPLFQGFLKEDCADITANRKVCKAIVAILFENFIENDQQSGVKSRQSILAFFAIFAQSGSHIFTFDQLQMLLPYTENLRTQQDLRLFQKVAKIYNAALRSLGTAQSSFVQSVQQKMIGSLGLIDPASTDLMDQVTLCLGTTCDILKDDRKLITIFAQVLQGMIGHKDTEGPKLTRFISMAGSFGKNWDLDKRVEVFRKTFSKWTFDTVSHLVVQILCAITKPERTEALQKAALRSICLTCQSKPKNYRKPEVSSLLDHVFQSRKGELEYVAVIGFRDFFTAEESKTKTKAEGEEPQGIEKSAERLGKSMHLSENDEAASFLAQKYLNDILRLAQSTTPHVALSAIEVITSTNRQGLVHPRESVPVLIALETAPNDHIAKLAYEEHRRMNTKYESILEKEYIKAIERAFAYQTNAIGDSAGSVNGIPKLAFFFKVLKEGSLAMRKKLLANICKRLDIPTAKLSLLKLEHSYKYAKFVCENLALAEYARVDEVMTVISALETIFESNGNILSQRIEAFSAAHGSDPSTLSSDEPLHRLALESMTLSLLWHTRTSLRETTTNLPVAPRKQAANAMAPGKAQKDRVRDVTKPPNHPSTRPTLVAAFLGRITPAAPLETSAAMLAQVAAFMELHSIDHDTRVSASDSDLDGEELGSIRLGTPSVDGSAGEPGSGAGAGLGAKRKRSGSGSAASTPSKTGRGPKRGRPSLERRKSSLGMTYAESDDGETDGVWE